MKTVAVPAILLFAAVGVAAGDSELERLAKSKLKALQEVSAALKTVADAKTAEAALGNVDGALERLIECDEVLGNPKTAAQLTKEKLGDRFGKPLGEAQAAVQAEVERLSKQPLVMKLIAEAAAWKRWQTVRVELQGNTVARKIVIGSAELRRTTQDLKTLDIALKYYFTRHGSYPDSLNDLTQHQPDGGPAIMKAEGMKDVWNRPYQYDPTQREPNTDRPRIWSQGPEPGQPGSEIANWTADSAPRKK
jgi:hypothetical protein